MAKLGSKGTWSRFTPSMVRSGNSMNTLCFVRHIGTTFSGSPCNWTGVGGFLSSTKTTSNISLPSASVDDLQLLTVASAPLVTLSSVASLRFSKTGIPLHMVNLPAMLPVEAGGISRIFSAWSLDITFPDLRGLRCSSSLPEGGFAFEYVSTA